MLCISAHPYYTAHKHILFLFLALSHEHTLHTHFSFSLIAFVCECVCECESRPHNGISAKMKKKLNFPLCFECCRMCCVAGFVCRFIYYFNSPCVSLRDGFMRVNLCSLWWLILSMQSRIFCGCHLCDSFCVAVYRCFCIYPGCIWLVSRKFTSNLYISAGMRKQFFVITICMCVCHFIIN